MRFVNNIVLLFTSKRRAQIKHFKKNAAEIQQSVLMDLIEKAVDTEYGKKYNFVSIKNHLDYAKQVPVVQYEDINSYVERTMAGENNVLWHESITWFAKSSGTTNAKSKFIPVSPSCLEECHFRGGKDAFVIFNKLFPDNKIFLGKTLALGGSSEINEYNKECKFGDLSAIMIANTPFWANIFKIPSPSVMLMSDWEDKIEKICETTVDEDVRCIVGVPSWFLTVINKILEKTGKENLHEVWPNLELFIHGGVSFTPYREQYKRLLPKENMKYLETYNASEGFFGVQDDLDDSSMLLILDNGVYYEFIPTSELGKNDTKAIPLEKVKEEINYAIIITTNSGLWRYMIGDTVTFTSCNPYKFKITGRTKLFINAFGEELIIDNATQALKYACEQTGANVFEYTAAPIFMDDKDKGAHEWLIEFNIMPNDVEVFIDILDAELQRLNSDYEAKRVLSLAKPRVKIARTQLFSDWLKQKGKLGGQNKIPRLWNDRTHIDELLELNY